MAAMTLQLMSTSTAMAQHSAATTAVNAIAPAAVAVPASHRQLNNLTFHDFLGVTEAEDHRGRPSGSSPAGSASAGASSGGGRGGPISATSDLGSEMQVGNPIQGVPFYGPRSDVSGSEIINDRLMRYKRSNSNSGFMGSAREYGTLHTRPEGHDNLPPMKMLRSGLGGEIRPRQPPPSSLMLHHPRTITTSRPDPRFVASSNMGPTFQSPMRGGPFMPPMQPPPNLQRGIQYHVIGAPVASQSAASDEGSRTGFKTQPGLLNFSQPGSSVMPVNTDPKGSNTQRCGHVIDVDALVGRQMTIFYGGQAHVFDEVNPDKADLIMNLAGSKGESWSTSSPSSAVPPRDPRQQIPGSSQLSLGFSDRRFSNTTGGLPRSMLGRDAGNPTHHHVAGDENRNL